LQKSHRERSQHTTDVSLHYLVKYNFSKFALFAAKAIADPTTRTEENMAVVGYI